MNKKTVSFTLPKGEHKKLEAIAKKDFSDISKTLRKMIASYTEQGKEQAK